MGLLRFMIIARTLFSVALFMFRSFSLSRHKKKKKNSKPFNEKSQEHENVVEDQYIIHMCTNRSPDILETFKLGES